MSGDACIPNCILSLLSDIAEDLYSGFLLSDCLLPCLRTTARVVKRFEYASESPFFFLSFSPTVEVRKTRPEKLTIFDVLIPLGASLALWPGLGLYQILEWIYMMLLGSRIMSKLCCCSTQKVDAEQ